MSESTSVFMTSSVPFARKAENNNDGSLVTYSVKETGKWTGYETEGPDTVSEEGIITNKESSIDIHILKVDKVSETPLTGAKFQLKRYDSGYHGVLETWNEQEVSYETGKEGTLTFEKLQIGSYELEETVPPTGYIKTFSNPRFTVTADQNGNLTVTFENNDPVTYAPADQTFTVRNESGAALPHTGGPGTRIFTIPGLILVCLAGALLRRKYLRPIREDGST